MTLEDKIKEKFENWIEWKLYKVLYIGILVPLLITEARNWIFQDFFAALVFFATAVILLLPSIAKIINIIEVICNFLDKFNNNPD